MASNLQFASTIRDNFNTQIINAVGASGFLKIYSGTAPANVAAALSGNTLLANIPLGSTFGVTSSGVLTVNGTPITESSADGSGTATFFRITDSAGNAKVQGTVGTSGCDLNMPSTTITATQPVQLTSLSFTAPGA